MLQSLNRHAFSEEVLSCARQKAISLEGGVPRFVTVQFKLNKVGEPIAVVDLWESDDALPYCPPGFAEAEVLPSCVASETLNRLWQVLPGVHSA